MHIQPYRHLKKYDIQCGKEKAYLCKGRAVMGQIVKYGGEESTTPETLVLEKDEVFAHGYEKLCDVIYPSLSKEAQDARRKGEIGYLRIYDLCGKFNLNNNNNELVHSV